MSSLKDQYGIKSMGEIGYEADGEHAGPGGPYTTFDGRPMPRWDELSATEQGRLTQARWETAAQAILKAKPAPAIGRAITPNGVGA
jgi:hypothetical protein